MLYIHKLHSLAFHNQNKAGHFTLLIQEYNFIGHIRKKTSTLKIHSKIKNLMQKLTEKQQVKRNQQIST